MLSLQIDHHSASQEILNLYEISTVITVFKKFRHARYKI